jgi:von Willebrand factor type A domain
LRFSLWIFVAAFLAGSVTGPAALASGGQVQEVKVAVTAPDPAGGYRADLKPGDFKVRLGDQPAAVTSVVSPQGDLVLLVVMDVIGDLGRIDTARQALVEQMEGLGPRQYVSVLQAQDGLQVVQDPTRDRKRLREAILNLPTAGSPGLMGAVEQASAIADSMLRKSDVRVAVLFLTDGSIYRYRGDYTSPVINPSDSSDLSRRFRDRLIQEKISTVLSALNASAAPLFFLHLESHTDALNVVYENGIQQFAQATAGEAIFCRSIAEIPTQLAQIIDRIRSLYTLTVRTSAPAGRRLRLDVMHPGGAEMIHRSHLELTFQGQPAQTEP